MTIQIKFVQSGFLRTKPEQIVRLKVAEYQPVAAGTVLDVLGYKDELGLFVKCTFDAFLAGRNTWLVYKPDIEMVGTEVGNKPNDSQSVVAVGEAMVFPGFDTPFHTGQTIISGGHFSWGEATHGGSRIPDDAEVVDGIKSIAQVLQEVRVKLGNRPIHVNSWYRDPATNRAVGGSSQSRHMWGDAVDFVVDGLHPYDVFDALDSWWGNQGGLASSSCFTHVDVRGYRARWDYGF
jgi:hypothetical protein